MAANRTATAGKFPGDWAGLASIPDERGQIEQVNQKSLTLLYGTIMAPGGRIVTAALRMVGLAELTSLAE